MLFPACCHSGSRDLLLVAGARLASSLLLQGCLRDRVEGFSWEAAWRRFGLWRRETQKDDIKGGFKADIKLNGSCFFPEIVLWEQIQCGPWRCPHSIVLNLGFFFSMGEILIPKKARGKLPSLNSSPAKHPPREVET